MKFQNPAEEAHFAEVATRCAPALVEAAKVEAYAHADYFEGVGGTNRDQAAANRYGHNLANIACGWITEVEPRYLGEFLAIAAPSYVRPAADAPAYDVVNYSARSLSGFSTRWQAIAVTVSGDTLGGYSPTFDTRAEAVTWVEAGSKVAGR